MRRATCARDSAARAFVPFAFSLWFAHGTCIWELRIHISRLVVHAHALAHTQTIVLLLCSSARLHPLHPLPTTSHFTKHATSARRRRALLCTAAHRYARGARRYHAAPASRAPHRPPRLAPRLTPRRRQRRRSGTWAGTRRRTCRRRSRSRGTARSPSRRRARGRGRRRARPRAAAGCSPPRRTSRRRGAARRVRIGRTRASRDEKSERAPGRSFRVDPRIRRGNRSAAPELMCSTYVGDHELRMSQKPSPVTSSTP